MRFILLLVATLAPGLAFAPPTARAQGVNPSFNLVNRAGQAIQEVYATPAGVPRWGLDRLQSFMIPPNQVFPVRLPADGTCLYDIRVVYADGTPEERRRLNTCQIEQVVFPGGRPAGPAPTPPGSNQAATDDPSFRLVNRGRSEINELYVSLPGNDRWGRDRLGDDTVARGATRVVPLPRGNCAYDVRVVFADGEAIERRRIDLCGITDLPVP